MHSKRLKVNRSSLLQGIWVWVWICRKSQSFLYMFCKVWLFSRFKIMLLHTLLQFLLLFTLTNMHQVFLRDIYLKVKLLTFRYMLVLLLILAVKKCINSRNNHTMGCLTAVNLNNLDTHISMGIISKTWCWVRKLKKSNSILFMNIFKKTESIYIIWGEIHINKWLQYTRDSTLQYSVINYSHHVVPYIHRAYLFSNRKFISFDHLHSFCSSPTLHLWQ